MRAPLSSAVRRLDRHVAICGACGSSDVKRHRITVVLVSALLGVFYWWVWMNALGMYLAVHPFNKWLVLDIQLPRHNRALYYLVIYVHDVIVNLLIAVPFASMFVVSARLN